jgi:lipoprotein-anchoring transpeptidase ErfK/SrfK
LAWFSRRCPPASGAELNQFRRAFGKYFFGRQADARRHPLAGAPGPRALFTRRDRWKVWRKREEGAARLRRSQNLPSSDKLTGDVWKKLTADDRPVIANYTIAEKDVSGPFLHELPAKMEEMQDIPNLSYASAREGLAEKFHMGEQLLAALNPGARFDHPGDTILVVDTGGQTKNSAKADRIEVDKSRQTVKLFDKSNALLGFYPATVGSEEKPSPTGTLKVTEISHNPTYRYNPDYHFKGVRSRKSFEIKPGPNNPVGTVWINLSAEGYGIHGTPSPGKVSKATSHGCVRLTNWDAERVANQVSKGTSVAFIGHPPS